MFPGQWSCHSVTMKKDKVLKKPWIIYILATALILAPFGNIVFTLFTLNLPSLSNVSLLVKILALVPLYDWIINGMIFISGLLLLRRHKTSWSFSILVLIGILVVNYVKWNSGLYPSETGLEKLQLASGFFVTTAVLLIAFYFRFPYLDRRSSFFFVTHRISGDWQGVLQSTDGQSVDIDIYSISMTGMGFRLPSHAEKNFSVGQSIEGKCSTFFQGQFRGQIVRKNETDCGIRFQGLTTEQKKHFKEFLRKLMQT